MKFKIGDRVILKKECEDYKGYPRFTYKRQICTISNVNNSIYGFKEDTNGDGRAHWCNVEDRFELAEITNWKKEMED